MPLVPLATYPAVTLGITFCVLLTDAVINPLALTEMAGFAVIVVAGVVAEPLGIALTVTSLNPSYPESAVTVYCEVEGDTVLL